jgi:hypothetical protein
MNRALLGYKWISILLALLAITLAALAAYQAARSQVVVLERAGQKEFFEGRRAPIQITDDDVKSVIEQWIRLRYEWREYLPEQIARNIGPISTEGLQAKIRDLLIKEKAHSPPEQHLAETVSGIDVKLEDHDASASLDLILRVNGIPLVIPTELSFQVIRDTPSRWNPTGLLVNGVIEKEQK